MEIALAQGQDDSVEGLRGLTDKSTTLEELSMLVRSTDRGQRTFALQKILQILQKNSLTLEEVKLIFSPKNKLLESLARLNFPQLEQEILLCSIFTQLFKILLGQEFLDLRETYELMNFGNQNLPYYRADRLYLNDFLDENLPEDEEKVEILNKILLERDFRMGMLK